MDGICRSCTGVFFLYDHKAAGYGKKKARGVLLHINVYMGNDKFKTLKLSVFSYQMNIMNLKDTENICGFSASVSEPPFQHSYIVLL